MSSGVGGGRLGGRRRGRPGRRCAAGGAACSPAGARPDLDHVVGPGRLGLGLGREVDGRVLADVVALGVVGVLAERLLVLGGDHATLGRLLDRQADAAALEVEVDDLDPQLLARGDHLLGQVDVVGGHLGDVDQTLDTLPHLQERAEGHQLGDPAVDQFADAVVVGELLPRVLLGGLERQADALPLEVDLEHLDLDLVADGDDRRRVVDVLPATARRRGPVRPCRPGRRRRRS